VLVALTLAGLATMRSVDTATLMAGNIAFRQSTLNAADQGVQAGYLLLKTPLGNPTADLTWDGMKVNKTGYFSSAAPKEPDWSNPLVWQNPERPAAQLNGGSADAAGNVVSFFVERLCTVANCKAGLSCDGGITVNSCGSTPTSRTLSGEGNDNFRVTPGLTTPPQPHYRITARALGPRNSVAVVQILTR
jgi:Tfp pilus assembly protein PilX